ncbi:hypothetical protein [Bdellovibrio sp. HCB337]|uniref:hypothetical protein n=1 Tax=Bdellovibrio sp. HCB337 TaxID=3394358 RepID=UPI0039A74E09
MQNRAGHQENLKRVWILIIVLVAIVLSGCGAGTGKNKNSKDPLAEYIPEWTSITYISNGNMVTLQPPFIATQNLYGDLNTGSCTGNTIEVNFNGIYNAATITSLSLTGLTATNNSNAGTFNFVACMALGSASVTITAYDSDGNALRIPLIVSLAAVNFVNTITLGEGHPRYPNTGLAMMSAAPRLENLTSGSTKMANVYMGSVAGKSTASTGNTGYTMETGLTNYVKQLSP